MDKHKGSLGWLGLVLILTPWTLIIGVVYFIIRHSAWVRVHSILLGG